ncbi:MAG: hypothetical protein KGZ96_08250 [Clostridia bacterium]|jgi:hypothetical protein|nr:hypothetical protein [Clostridia bacterium]
MADITEQTFGRLTVMRYFNKNEYGTSIWVCKCSCGNNSLVYVTSSNLGNGSTKSCGCLNKERKPKEDLTGKTFNDLTVVRLHTAKSVDRRFLWECECACGRGEVVIASSKDLKGGRKRSCSCMYNKKRRASVDLTGQIFNMLKVEKFLNKRNADGEFLWQCLCDCGSNTEVATGDLTKNAVKSCGCLKGKNQFDNPSYLYKSYPRIYRIWQGIKKRCANPNYESYANYGGRGIKVCEKWQEFPAFLFWALENGYEKNREIDRINNNGNYEPSNCRWVTAKENSRNKSNNRHITIKGVTKTMAEWAEIAGVLPKTISDRIERGWPEEDLSLTRGSRRKIKIK